MVCDARIFQWPAAHDPRAARRARNGRNGVGNMPLFSHQAPPGTRHVRALLLPPRNLVLNVIL
jgi:hypothetical protein